MRRIIAKLKIVPVLITLLVGAVAANTGLQLWIQKDITAKSEDLEQGLAESTEKSNKMNNQLNTVAELKKHTQLLNRKVQAVEANTSGLDKKLKELDRVVAAIAERVKSISHNTGMTEKDLKEIEITVAASTQALRSIESSNQNIVSTLKAMEGIQTEVNAQLKEIDHKTRLIPAKP